MSPHSPQEEELPGFQPRRSGRIALAGETVNLSPNAPGAIEATIQNVSSAGFMAECGEPVMIGSYVSLDVPGIGPVQAQVRWQLGNRLGGMFLDPISLARCEWVAEHAGGA